VVLVSGDKSVKDLPLEYQQAIHSHLSWEYRSDLPRAKALAQDLANLKPDIAHFHFGGTFEWSSNRFGRCPVLQLARLGIPCVTTNHLANDWLDCGVHPDRPIAYKWAAQFYAWVSRAQLYQRLGWEVCVSKHDQARMHRMFPIFRGKIIQRYHSLLPGDAPPPELNNREPAIICVGTIGGRKAQPLLADAFAAIAAKHPAWRLDLIGRTGYEADAARVKQITAQNKLEGRINLCGRLSDEETLSRMKSASIFAMPSLAEGLGLSLQEALFHGCVAVGSRVGGIPELIDDNTNGLLVPAGDVPALSAALDRVMSDSALLGRLRAEARPSIVRKGMTAPAMVDAYRELYRGVTQRDE